jgi:uncharacterized protein (TIGR03067 family)
MKKAALTPRPRRQSRDSAPLRALRGEWTFISAEVDGQTMPAAMLRETRILMDRDRFRMESPEAVHEGVFSVDVSTDPASIDIEFVEGPDAGNWSYGIYRLDGDSLLFCLGVAGADRPTTFVSRAGSGHALERLVRSAKAPGSPVTGGQRRAHAAQPHDVVVDERAFDQPMTPFLERLQGEWTPLTLITDGKPLAESFLPFGIRTITGVETKVVFGGQVMVHARMRLDESQSPIAVDYLNVGRGAKGVTHGVIALDGELVRICMAEPGAERPSDFSCEKGSGRTFSEWKRRAAAHT